MTSSGINDRCFVPARFSHDAVDDFFAVACSFLLELFAVTMIVKADIDSAFRRIPTMPQHRIFAFVFCSFQGHGRHVRGWSSFYAVRWFGVWRSLEASWYFLVGCGAPDHFHTNPPLRGRLPCSRTTRMLRACSAMLRTFCPSALGASSIVDRKLPTQKPLPVFGLIVPVSAYGFQ